MHHRNEGSFSGNIQNDEEIGDLTVEQAGSSLCLYHPNQDCEQHVHRCLLDKNVCKDI